MSEKNHDVQGARSSEELLRLGVQSAREFAIFTSDLELRITGWSRGAERLLGHLEEEVLGQSGAIIFTKEDRVAGAPETERSVALQKGSASDERWHERKDGSRFWGSGLMMVMHDPAGRTIGLVKIMRDATQERVYQEALKQSRDELREALLRNEQARMEAESASRAKDHFLAILSHELRTPLTPVLWAAKGILQEPGLTSEMREALEMISNNVQLEARLIDDLLDLTKIAHGKLEMSPESLNLHDVLRRVVVVCQADLQEKRQRLEADFSASRDSRVGDPRRLQQVFWNIIKNSSKFSPVEGSIRLRTRNEHPEWIAVEVTDSGIGIDPDYLPKIFNAFEQTAGSITRQYGGVGLGLAITKAIVEAHGGTITASSDGAGKGAAFTVRLPLTEIK